MLTAWKHTHLQKQSSVSLRIEPALKLWLPKRKYIFSVVFFSVLKKGSAFTRSRVSLVQSQLRDKQNQRQTCSETEYTAMKTFTSPKDTHFCAEKKNLLSLCFGKETQLVQDKTNTPLKTHLGFVSKLEPPTFALC